MACNASPADACGLDCAGRDRDGSRHCITLHRCPSHPPAQTLAFRADPYDGRRTATVPLVRVQRAENQHPE